MCVTESAQQIVGVLKCLRPLEAKLRATRQRARSEQLCLHRCLQLPTTG